MRILPPPNSVSSSDIEEFLIENCIFSAVLFVVSTILRAFLLLAVTELPPIVRYDGVYILSIVERVTPFALKIVVL